MTRAALASAARVSERQIGRIENGQTRQIRDETAKRLATGLGVSIDALTDASFLSHLGSRCEIAEGDRDDRKELLDLLGGHASFDLIRSKYGWTQERVVQLAPALFLLLADRSVRWHRERLQQLERSLRASGDTGLVDRVLLLARKDEHLGELMEDAGGKVLHGRFDRVFAEYLRTLASGD